MKGGKFALTPEDIREKARTHHLGWIRKTYHISILTIRAALKDDPVYQESRSLCKE